MRLSSKGLFYVLVLSYFFDGLNSVLLRTPGAYDRVSVFFRAGIEIYILIAFVFNEKFQRQFVFILVLCVLFIVGQASLSLTADRSNFLESFIIENKYLYFIFLSVAFIAVSNTKNFRADISKAMNVIFTLNNAAIILGLLFGLSVFASYYSIGMGDFRFGYKGLIPAQNETSGVYFFGLAYYFREYFGRNNKRALPLLISTIVAALFLGTKAGVFFTSVMLFYFLFKYRRKLSLYLLLPTLGVVMIIWGTEIYNYLVFRVFAFVSSFYFSQGMSLFTVLLMGRNELLVSTAKWVFAHWTPLNYIAGGSLVFHSTEMDLFDGYLMMGIGFIFYLIYYIRIWVIRNHESDTLFLLSLFLVVSSLGGHMIYSAIVPAYMLSYAFLEQKAKKMKKLRPVKSNA